MFEFLKDQVAYLAWWYALCGHQKFLAPRRLFVSRALYLARNESSAWASRVGQVLITYLITRFPFSSFYPHEYILSLQYLTRPIIYILYLVGNLPCPQGLLNSYVFISFNFIYYASIFLNIFHCLINIKKNK